MCKFIFFYRCVDITPSYFFFDISPRKIFCCLLCYYSSYFSKISSCKTNYRVQLLLHLIWRSINWWGEKREVFHVILFRGGGVYNILEKRHAARGDLSYSFTWGGLGACFPENFLKMVQPYLKISQTLCNFSIPLKSFSTPLKFINPTEKAQPLPKKFQSLLKNLNPPKNLNASRKSLNPPEKIPTPPEKISTP